MSQTTSEKNRAAVNSCYSMFFNQLLTEFHLKHAHTQTPCLFIIMQVSVNPGHCFASYLFANYEIEVKNAL